MSLDTITEHLTLKEVKKMSHEEISKKMDENYSRFLNNYEYPDFVDFKCPK